MHPLVVLAVAMLIPFACLGLLFWLAWLEDTLDVAVQKSKRRRVPNPVLAIPVDPGTRPEQLRVPEPLHVPATLGVVESPPVPAQTSVDRAEERLTGSPARVQQGSGSTEPTAIPAVS